MMPATRRFAMPLAALAAGAGVALPLETAQAQRACRVAEVLVSPADAQVAVGGRYPFVATAFDASGNPCESITFVWTSSSNDIAIVEEGGIAIGIAPGVATLTARTGRGATARSGNTRIEVTEGNAPAAPMIPGLNRVANRPQGTGYAAYDRQPEGSGPADQLLLAPARITLVRGERKIIEEMRAVRADGANAGRVPIVFTIDPGGERIISVDSFGIVRSLGDTGTANVRASVPGNSRIQANLVRVEVRGDAVQFPRPVMSLTPGTVETLSVFVPAQQRALDPAALFRFSSSDTTRVRVNPVHPIIEAVAPGTARITAASPFSDIHVTVNVHRAVDRLTLAPPDSGFTIAIGGTRSVRAEAVAADGTPIAEAPLAWRNPDSTIASISGERGQRVITGRRMGNAVITVAAPGPGDRAITRDIRVRVVAGGLAVTQPRVALPAGQRSPIEASILDETRTAIGSANEFLSWTSSADSIARVESNQLVGLRPGLARITGRSTWDSTVTITVYVLGDMIAAAQQGGRWDLLTLWDNMSRSMALTSDSLIEGHPSWSPDLARVAYTATSLTARAPVSALWVMDADGSNGVRLTDDSAQVEWPRWTPDGRRIVFSWNKGGRSQIWAHEFGPDGAAGANRQITTATPALSNTAPSVAPDGTRLAYVSRRQTSPGREANVILQANPDGSEERIIITSGTQVDQPLYAPDGRTLYFLRVETGRGQVRRVYRHNLNGAPTDTATALTPASMFVQSYSVGADGQSLALHVLEPGPNNTQAPRVVLFRIASGEITAVGQAGERMASPALRPATRP